MAEYTEAFARFILEARDAYNELCDKVDRGLVLKGQSATVRITLTPAMVDQVREEQLDTMASTANGDGDG